MARKAKVSNEVKAKKHRMSSAEQIDESLIPGLAGDKSEREAFSGWPIIICWLAMLIFTFHACTHMVAAGDTWVAMACGRHFVNHGVDTVEPFSANSHKAGPTEEEIKTWPNWAQWITSKVGLKTVKYWHPTGWINQNWLTHVLFYSLVPKSSYADGVSFPSNALVYWKFAIYIITMICVYYTGRLLGVNPVLCTIFSCFSLFVGRSFLDIRPAGFSNMLVAVFLLILVLTTYRNVLYIWLIVPVTIFWCNVHGGYIYAFIMLVPFIGLNLLASCNKKWTAILYNVTAWPFLYFVFSKAGFTLATFLFLILVIVLDFILIFFKKNLVSIGWRGVYHAIAASIVAFVGVVLFNPFHFTNLTHTFVISVSEHAARWREIHEWHPAFGWDNPVGTGFPFLVLFILGIGLFIFWLFSHYLKSKCLNTLKRNLESQKKVITIQLRIFGCAAAIVVCWVLFISFSFLNYDLADFLLCALFVGILLLSILKSVHFIYLIVLFVTLAMSTSKADVGYAGRYIYPFVILPGYVLLCILISFFSETVKNKPKNIIFVTLTSVISLLLMTVFFNPFKFETIWNVQQFFELQRIWRPVYESNLELRYAYIFNELYILNIASIILWLGIPQLKNIFSRATNIKDEKLESKTYYWPKIDLAIILIAALTVYMAIRSRRFIPIAAIAACPIIAMFIDHIVRVLSAMKNFLKNNRMIVSEMSPRIQSSFAFFGIVAVLFFGTWWGLKFKSIYLDPWPRDPKLTSVFMRMTDSGQKPFYACKFIKDNKLKGKMFNYWTEGGFIAFGQEPDPNTGRTPLRLFMDGRAQAAYNRDIFDKWSYIMSGGQLTAQLVARARARGRQSLSASDYTEIGKWMNERLREENAWVVLMPHSTYSPPPPDEYYKKTSYHAVQGLERNPNWPLVFFNNKQKLFVDIGTPQGKALFDGIFNGSNIYPDEFHRDLISAHSWLFYRFGVKEKQKGFDFAVRAFNLNPSPAPMREIIFIAPQFAEIKPQVEKFCEGYVKDFVENESVWMRQNGYRNRVEAARMACLYLGNIARKMKNTELADFYDTQASKCVSELLRVAQDKRW